LAARKSPARGRKARDTKAALGDLQSGEYARHQAAAVIDVVDDEVLADADGFAVPAQQARRQRVKGAQPHAPQIVAAVCQQFGDALAHLASGLVGERDGEDATRIRAHRHQPRQTIGDDARLARAGSGDDEQRIGGMDDRFKLRGVELSRQHLAREAARRLVRGIVLREQVESFHGGPTYPRLACPGARGFLLS
jgi:hypothetical protein